MERIIPFSRIKAYLETLRKTQTPPPKVVFTNGCFDLIHRGHVQYLSQARSLGDLLIVGLNSDASVKRLKGPQRPLMSEQDRAYILSQLRSVDVVCIFEEDTPLELIKKVKPDVLVKGGDYQISQIVGRELVESYGGKVVTVPFVSGLSTSELIRKIKQS